MCLLPLQIHSRYYIYHPSTACIFCKFAGHSIPASTECNWWAYFHFLLLFSSVLVGSLLGTNHWWFHHTRSWTFWKWPADQRKRYSIIKMACLTPLHIHESHNSKEKSSTAVKWKFNLSQTFPTFFFAIKPNGPKFCCLKLIARVPA